MFGRVDPAAGRANRETFVALLTRALVGIVREGRGIAGRDRILVVKLLKQALRLDDAQLERVRRSLSREAAEAPDTDGLIAEFRASCAPGARPLLADLCCRLATATWPPSEERLARARRVVSALGLDPLRRRDLELRYGLPPEQPRAREQSRRPGEAEGGEARREQARREEAGRGASRAGGGRPASEDERAFAALGLPPDAPFSAVRKAYRKLAQRHHPDAAAHPDEAHRRAATEKMQALNAAYDRLERLLGKATDESSR